MQQPVGHAALPVEADIEKISAVLRDDRSAQVLAEMAERLLQLASAEPHPQLRAAVLDRAAAMLTDLDRQRALELWRESFRLFPEANVGRRLQSLAADDASFARLNRLGHLVDAIAELSEPSVRVDALLSAAQAHVQQGHGNAAQATLQRLLDGLTEADQTPELNAQLLELTEIAAQQAESRQEALQAMRMELAEASDDDRPRLLLGYADMLLHGDEPLADAAAVLADAADTGVQAAEVVPMWVEVARAMGDVAEMGRALALAVADADNPHRLQHADELANLPDIERLQPDALVTALRTLAAVNPDDNALHARLAVAQAYGQGVGADAALEALRLKALQARDRVLESAACLALAQLAQQAGDADKAERHFRRVRSLSPQNPEALDFFEQWYRRAGDHRRLFAALSQRAAQSEGKVLIRIALEMAQLAEGPLAAGDPTGSLDRAIEAYQRVLTAQPDHMDAIAALERALTSSGRWQELAALLARSAYVFAPRAVIDSSARDFAIALWNRLAALHRDPERAPDPNAALDASEHVLDLDPRQPEALQAVVAHHGDAGDWPTVREVLLAAVDAAQDPHELAALSQQLGELFRDHLNDPEAAATWLDRAAMSEPDRADARQQAQALWRARGDREKLLEALLSDLSGRWNQEPDQVDFTQVLQLTPEDDRQQVADILQEAAELAGQNPHAQPLAAHLWSLLVALKPGDLTALEALQHLWTVSESARLIASLQFQAAHAEIAEPRKIAVLERLCVLLLATENLQAALQSAEELVALDPHSHVARTTRLHALVAQGNLPALRATFPDDAEGSAAFAAAVAAVADGRTGAERAKLLIAAAESASTPGNAAEWLADAVGALENGDQDENSAQALVSAAERLWEIAHGAGLVGFERLAVETLATRAPTEHLPRYKKMRTEFLTSAGLWSEAAASAGEWVEDLLATATWTQVAEAVRELQETSRRAGELDVLPHRLLAWAEVVPEGEASTALKVQLWLDAAHLLLTSGVDLETARQAADLATEAQPNNLQVLSMRERICTEQADWPAVVATLERLAEVQEPGDRIDTLLRAANLCDHALNEPATAAQLYRMVLEEAPQTPANSSENASSENASSESGAHAPAATGNLEAWFGLAAALRKSGTVHERADVLDALLAREDVTRESRARLALERVELARQREETDPELAALPVLKALGPEADLADNPLTLSESEQAVLALGLTLMERRKHAQQTDLAVQTALTLLPILRTTGRTAETLQALDVLVELAPDDAETPKRLEEAANLAGGDPSRLFAAARSAAQKDPSPEKLEKLADLAATTGRNEELFAFLADVAGGDGDATSRHLTARLLAGRATAAGDADRARAAWQQVLAIEADDAEALEALTILLAAADDQLGAFTHAARLLTVHPENEQVLGQMQTLAQHPEVGVEKLVTALQTAIQHAKDVPTRQRLRQTIRLVLPGDASALPERRALAEAALTDDPGDATWLELAQIWATDAGDDEAALEFLHKRVAATTDAADLQRLQRERAHLADKLGKPAEAQEAWRTLLDSADAETRREAASALADLCERTGDRAGEATALLALKAVTEDAESQLALTLRIADAWNAAGERDKALDLLRTEAQNHPTDDSLYQMRLSLLEEGPEKTELLRSAWQNLARDTADRATAAEAWLAAQESNGERAESHGEPAEAWSRLQEVLDAGLTNAALTERLHRLTTSADAAVAAAAGARWAEQAASTGDVSAALEWMLHGQKGADPLQALTEARALAERHGKLETWLAAAENFLADGDLTSEHLQAVAAMSAETAVQLGAFDHAAAIWQTVWDEDADNQAARDQVLALRRQAGQPQQLATAVERAMLLGGPDRGALRVELAGLKAQLGKNREALRLLQDAIVSEPDRTDVAPIARELMLDPLLLDETLELLERIYRNQNQWPELTEILQKRLERAQRPTQRVAIAQVLANVQQQHGDVKQAAESLLAVLQSSLTLESLASLERLCSADVEPDALARAYDLILATDLAPAQRLAVLQRAAEFDLARVAHVQAEARLRELIALKPDDDAAFAHLTSLMMEPARRADLLEAWRLRLRAGPETQRERQCYAEIVTLSRALGDLNGALATAQEWTESHADETAAHQALVEVLGELDRPAELVTALVTLAQWTEDSAERAKILVEAAREYEKLHDEDGRQAAYESAFDADPTHDEAFVFLDKKAGTEPGKLIPLYARRSEALPPGPTRTLILRKLANAAADLNDGTTACRALETALADDASNAVVLDELLRISEQQHEWEIWLKTAEKRLALETRKDGKAHIRRQMARVTLTERVDVAAAAEHLAQLEKLTPSDPAVAQLKTMLQARSADPREAIAGLEALLKSTQDPVTQTSIHQQLADLFAGPQATPETENPGKAIRELVRLVQLDPRRWTARRKLCDLYKARGSLEAYAESLRQWLQALGDSRDAHTLSPERISQLGALQLELGEALAAVGQVNEAASVLKDALILSGHSARLDAILAQMLEATSDTAGAAELEDWLVAHHAQGDREQMAQHALKAGALWEQLGEHQKSRDAFKRVLDVRPEDARAMLGQGRACLEMHDTDRALRLFDAVSRSSKADVAIRADALVGMGRCRMARLALDQARTCYERALQLMPGHRGALDGLSEL